LADSQRLFASASRDLLDAQRDFQELCAYFGEEEALDPEALFSLVITFIRGIEAATRVAEKNVEKAMKAAARVNN
jgi:hypothetical protein